MDEKLRAENIELKEMLRNVDKFLDKKEESLQMERFNWRRQIDKRGTKLTIEDICQRELETIVIIQEKIKKFINN